MTDPTFEAVSSFYPVQWSGTRFVLPGIRSGAVVFWTSPDGERWTLAPEQSSGYTAEFAFERSGAGLAVGFLNQWAVVWHSTDGTHWIPLPEQASLRPRGTELALQMRHVAKGAAGYVALGDVNGGPGHYSGAVVFSSSDGLTWTRREAGVIGPVFMPELGAIGGRYVVAGTLDREQPSQRAAIWTSADGVAWTEIPVTGSAVTGLAVGNGRLILTGLVEGVGSSAPAVGRTWSTVDGTSFSATDGAPIYGLASTPWGFIGGAVPDCQGALTATSCSVVVGSTDGVTWHDVALAPGPRPDALSPTVAVTPGLQGVSIAPVN